MDDPDSPSGIDALIFDLGGVLIAEGPPVGRDRWEDRLGLGRGDLIGALREAIGPGWAGGRSEDEIRRRLQSALGLSEADFVRFRQDIYSHEYLEPALARFIIAARRRYRIATLSNNGPQARAAMDARFGLDGLVDLAVYSGEDRVEKPDRRIFELTAERLGTTPGRCLFVDDKETNVRAAEALSITGVVHRDAESTLTAIRAALGMIEHDYRAAGGVVVDDNRVLLQRRESRDEWRLPKGHVEAGETDEDAAVREVAEESAYFDVVIERDLGTRHLDFDAFVHDGPGHHVRRDEHYFRMGLRTASMHHRRPEELKFEPRWVAADEAAHLLTYDFERQWLAAAVPEMAGP